MIREFEWRFKSLKIPSSLQLLAERAINRLAELTGEDYRWGSMLWGTRLVFETNGIVLFPVERLGPKNPATRKYVVIGIDFDKQPEDFFFLRTENDDFELCAQRLGLVTETQKLRLRQLITPKGEKAQNQAKP